MYFSRGSRGLTILLSCFRKRIRFECPQETFSGFIFFTFEDQAIMGFSCTMLNGQCNFRETSTARWRSLSCPHLV